MTKITNCSIMAPSRQRAGLLRCVVALQKFQRLLSTVLEYDLQLQSRTSSHLVQFFFVCLQLVKSYPLFFRKPPIRIQVIFN